MTSLSIDSKNRKKLKVCMENVHVWKNDSVSIVKNDPRYAYVDGSCAQNARDRWHKVGALYINVLRTASDSVILQHLGLGVIAHLTSRLIAYIYIYARHLIACARASCGIPFPTCSGQQRRLCGTPPSSSGRRQVWTMSMADSCPAPDKGEPPPQ